MLSTRFLAVLSILAVGLGAASTVQAAPNLYQGSWIAQSFGNDRYNGTGGQTESDQAEWGGVPLGNNCNAINPRCPWGQTGASVDTGPTKTSTPPLTPKKFDALAPFCVPNSAFGLAPTRPAKGGTVTTGGGFKRPIPPQFRNPNHFTTTTPSGAGKTTACSDASTFLGGKATTFALTTNDPKRGVGQKGAPLLGAGLASTVGGADPRAFTFPAALPTFSGSPYAGFRVTTTGSFSNFAPYLYSYTYATLRNGSGSFAKGGGFFTAGAVPTTASFPYKKGGGTVAKVKVTKGTNNFGGVMRLLGKMVNKVCYFRNGGCSLGEHNWRYDAAGTSGSYGTGTNTSTKGVLTSPYTVMYSAIYYHTLLMQQSVVMAVGSRFPWTTGTVTVTATGRGPNNTIEQRQGNDNRVAGIGTVQVVSPIITKWLQPSVNFETGGIAVMRLVFLPEPQKWAMLVAGVSALGVLYRFRGR